MWSWTASWPRCFLGFPVVLGLSLQASCGVRLCASDLKILWGGTWAARTCLAWHLEA